MSNLDTFLTSNHLDPLRHKKSRRATMCFSCSFALLGFGLSRAGGREKKILNPRCPSWTHSPQGISISANTVSITVFKISLGSCSISRCERAVKSRVRVCSHKITPVVFVLESKGMCKGNLLSVFVIGQTIASCVVRLKKSLLITTAGR